MPVSYINNKGAVKTEIMDHSSYQGQIKELDRDSIRFISAGREISDITTVVRELVENSIDAGATMIEVKLSKFGTECIEVSDNGSGIDELNFETIASRYYTSKISDYHQMQESLQTFGFRGEALSCICEMANVTITTKARQSPTGSKLLFKKDGSLDKAIPVARADGTSVIVKNLFNSMPVRRKELESSAKRQYDKVVKLLHEQILARPHVKFSLAKKSTTSKEKDFTHGGADLEGCIINIFGVKILDTIIPIKQSGLVNQALDNPINGTTQERDNNESSQFQTQTQARTQTQTQTQTMTQGNIEVSTGVDELVHSVEETLKKVECLGKNFEPAIEPKREVQFFQRSRKSKFARKRANYTFHGYISRIGKGRNSSDCQFLFVNKKPCDIPKLSKLINEIYKGYSNNQYPFYILYVQVENCCVDFNVPHKRTPILQDETKLYDSVKESLEEMFSHGVPANQKSCPSALIPVATTKQQSESPSESQSQQQQQSQQTKQQQQQSPASTDDIVSSSQNATKRRLELTPEEQEESARPSKKPTIENTDGAPENVDLMDIDNDNAGSQYFDTQEDNPVPVPELNPKNGFVTALELHEYNRSWAVVPVTLYAKPISPEPEKECRFMQTKMSSDGSIKVSIDQLEDLGGALERERYQRTITDDSKSYSFAIHPNFNTVAEQELKLNLDKSYFKEMHIIGQFNRGFIIVRLNRHIFIIDQHASDERANYEDQLDKSPLIKQTMVVGKPLYLNSMQENIVIENLEAFKKRGFEFKIDKFQMPGYRVLMTATSICKGPTLDEHLMKEDVEELIDIIRESPKQLERYTLRKVKNVSATKACRKSVMIGDSLNWNQMEDIVSKMSNLENPWICAHNRPTIRHLMDIDWMSADT